MVKYRNISLDYQYISSNMYISRNNSSKYNLISLTGINIKSHQLMYKDINKSVLLDYSWFNYISILRSTILAICYYTNLRRLGISIFMYYMRILIICFD